MAVVSHILTLSISLIQHSMRTEYNSMLWCSYSTKKKWKEKSIHVIVFSTFEFEETENDGWTASVASLNAFST